jgi:hypothetical protein
VAIAFAAGAGVGYQRGSGDVASLEKTLARMERLQVMMPKIERFVELSDELDRLQGARLLNRRHGERNCLSAMRTTAPRLCNSRTATRGDVKR